MRQKNNPPRTSANLQKIFFSWNTTWYESTDQTYRLRIATVVWIESFYVNHKCNSESPMGEFLEKKNVLWQDYTICNLKKRVLVVKLKLFVIIRFIEFSTTQFFSYFFLPLILNLKEETSQTMFYNSPFVAH